MDPSARMKELKSGLDTHIRQLQVLEANIRECGASIEQFKGAIALCTELVEATVDNIESNEDGEGDNA
jgi:hypothetical protein|tara:strand:- start:6753 stop:6956 length:204 start_codon:yes stop_codon:yes gene_type:complete